MTPWHKDFGVYFLELGWSGFGFDWGGQGYEYVGGMVSRGEGVSVTWKVGWQWGW